MGKRNIIHLIKKVLTGTATPEDEQEVDQHFVESFISDEWNTREWGDRDKVRKRVISGTNERIRRRKAQRVYSLKRFLPYAAAVVILIGLGIYINPFSKRVGRDMPATSVQVKNQLLPGEDVASLELSDGTILDLSSLEDGEQVHESDISIRKTRNGNIEYVYKEDFSPTAKGESELNTLKTPLGGTYQITLADGTKAWLNAGSSLRFPKKFSENRRMVYADGEVYFEVAHDAEKPFIVNTSGLDIRVLGTKFNLSAYSGNGPVSVALVEGSVQMKTPDGNTSMLIPGKKGIVENGKIEVESFDAESEIAWKNNYFIFKDQNIKEIMNSLSRWYNADVSYEGGVNWEGKNFTVRMSRRENINEILSLIELTQSVKFKIDGRKITVSQN